ncbi:N-6 DNA methylase [Candidatus Vondammii sp. HM_W22]|uniref:N-6 DNA methylase n=1 Tax=Candidatus Vondammii sp. HM_W22 TaxID=2687299 RepID=UPI002E7B8132|nr:N-6 DNA methylase [Candidatus Vondammii sp. HM_W22]
MNRLTKELISLHNQKGLRADQWFSLMIDDVLAGFGIKLTEIPAEPVREVLFNLTGMYAQEVLKAEPFTDLLSTVYMDMGSNYQRSGMGQFFTPESVCRLLARMTIGSDFDHLAERKRLIRMQEPAVGAGGMVLAFLAEILERQGPEAIKWISVTGIDLDRMCCRLFPCQVLSSLLVNRIELGELISYHGNTLGDPTQWSTVCHYSRRDLPEEIHEADSPQVKKAVAEAVANPVTSSLSQLDQMQLF